MTAQMNLCFWSYGLLWGVYELMKGHGMSAGLAGATAASMSWVFYPFEVVRTRVQMSLFVDGHLTSTVGSHYASLWQQGFKHWYPGISLTLVRTVPRYYTTFFMLEWFRKLR